MFIDEVFSGGVALVEIDGADDGFEAVGDNDGVGAVDAVLLAARKADEWLVAKFVTGVRNRFGAHEGRAPGGHDAFGLFVVAIKKVACDELEDGVAEVFEALVVLEMGFFVLVNVAAVSEGNNEEVDIVKFKAEFLFGEILIGFSVQFSILLNGFSFLLLT